MKNENYIHYHRSNYATYGLNYRSDNPTSNTAVWKTQKFLDYGKRYREIRFNDKDLKVLSDYYTSLYYSSFKDEELNKYNTVSPRVLEALRKVLSSGLVTGLNEMNLTTEDVINVLQNSTSNFANAGKNVKWNKLVKNNKKSIKIENFELYYGQLLKLFETAFKNADLAINNLNNPNFKNKDKAIYKGITDESQIRDKINEIMHKMSIIKESITNSELSDYYSDNKLNMQAKIGSQTVQQLYQEMLDILALYKASGIYFLAGPAGELLPAIQSVSGRLTDNMTAQQIWYLLKPILSGEKQVNERGRFTVKVPKELENIDFKSTSDKSTFTVGGIGTISTSYNVNRNATADITIDLSTLDKAVDKLSERAKNMSNKINISIKNYSTTKNGVEVLSGNFFYRIMAMGSEFTGHYLNLIGTHKSSRTTSYSKGAKELINSDVQSATTAATYAMAKRGLLGADRLNYASDIILINDRNARTINIIGTANILNNMHDDLDNIKQYIHFNIGENNIAKFNEWNGTIGQPDKINAYKRISNFLSDLHSLNLRVTLTKSAIDNYGVNKNTK